MSDLPNTSGLAGTTDIDAADRARLGAAWAPGQHHTLACLFETRAAADRAAEDLVNSGIARSTIEVVDRAGEPATAEVATEGGGLWESIKRLFTGDDDAAGYYEGVSRGQTLLTVHVRDEAEADRISAILERHDPIDIAAQEASWRESGWRGEPPVATTAQAATPVVGTTPVDVTATPGTKPMARTGALGEPALAGRATERSVAAGGEQVIPVVEENLAIGKRAVSGGRVRVHAYVVETPVEQDVRLKDERVEVERRPANRPLDATDEAFRERTVEMTETREEAVVGKTARVTEEVVIRKQAGERTEHVSDTTRRTEVKIDQDKVTPTETDVTPAIAPGTPAPRRR